MGQGGWHKGRIQFSAQNKGAGGAANVGFCLVNGDEYTTGYVGALYGGFLKPGDFETVITHLTGQGGSSAPCVVTCEDVIGYFHAWSDDGRYRRWRTRTRLGGRRLPVPTREQAFNALYPNIGLSGKQSVGGRTIGVVPGRSGT